MKDIWNLKYDWDLTGSTWSRIERLDTYWSGVTYVPDNYFKYKKCLSGITYQYVNTLDDIYSKNAMVGKTWCIYDMYNEFDIINNFMVNMDTVDICCTTNIDLTERYYTLDNAYLKTKHKVLLVNQTDKTENDLYNVDQRGFLITSTHLLNSGNTFRYKGYVKLGDNKHNQYHLKDVGGVFPTSGLPASYMLGKTYIIKHFFTYNINAVDPIPKLIFTDYDIARHINPLNYSLYTGFTMSDTLINGEKVVIKYHDYEYVITLNNTTSDFVHTGTISGDTIYNGLYTSPGGTSSQFFVSGSTNFYTNASVGDYLKVTFSGDTNTNLIYYTHIKFKSDSPVLVLQNPVPTNILNDFYVSGGTYTLTNLQYSEVSAIKDTLLETYHSKYFDVDDSMYFSPKYYDYNHYFDYDGLQFIYSGTTYTEYAFTTDNTYIKYKLYEHLNSINSVFDNSYIISNYPNVSLSSFSTGFTVLITDTQSSEYYNRYPKGTYIKITPDDTNDMYFFRKNTFVKLNDDDTYKTLIVDYVPNQYFIIETYKSDSGLTITSIDSIYTLTGISDLLYSVYKNDENDWYRERPDNIRKNICNSYSRIIEKDSNIVKNVTALLTQDDKNKFILELYNPENLLNNGENITFTYDPNLTYKPIELIDIGVDKHTKIPLPILTENLLITYDLLTGVTSGSTTGSTSYDTFTFIVDSSTSFSYTFESTNTTTLSVDWGDGSSLENITFSGVYSGSHTFASDGVFRVIFSGDLQYIYHLSSNSNLINKVDITKIKNLTTLNLNDNIIDEMEINDLVYLRYLYLNTNTFDDVDKFFNELDSNGLINGVIDTGGTGNAPVTATSLVARTNLVSKGWTLTYN